MQGVVTTYWLLLVVRFLLDVVEAVVLPAMLVFLSHWFSKAERGRADTFLILGNPVTLLWMSVVSGYLVAASQRRAKSSTVLYARDTSVLRRSLKFTDELARR